MWGSNFGYCRGEKNRKKSRIHQTHQSIDVFKDVKRKQTLMSFSASQLNYKTQQDILFFHCTLRVLSYFLELYQLEL